MKTLDEKELENVSGGNYIKIKPVSRKGVEIPFEQASNYRMQMVVAGIKGSDVEIVGTLVAVKDDGNERSYLIGGPEVEKVPQDYSASIYTLYTYSII